MAVTDSNACGLLDTLIREHARLKQALQAKTTREGYRADWKDFVAFTVRAGVESLPASVETVALYITDMVVTRGLKTSTATRRVAAIADRHKANNHPSPVTADVRMLLRAARRLRIEGVRQVRPLTIEQLRQISVLLAIRDTPLDLRNRAMLVVGFGTALRSEALSALRLTDAEFCERGVVIHVRKDKTDQEARGRPIAIPHGKHPETCGARCLKDWIARRGSSAGPLFSRCNHHRRNQGLPLQPERFCQIVQECVAAIGVDPKEYGSHSLRAGLVSAGGENNVSDLLLASQTGHKDMGTLRKYFRHRDIWRANPLELLDL